METERQKIVCLSFYDQAYSRGSVYLNSSYVKSYDLFFKKIDSGLRNSLRMTYLLSKSEKNTNTIFVVLSPSHVLVPLLRLFWRGKIVLDAGWPMTDAAISRGFNLTKPWKLMKSVAIDFMSFRLATRVIVESAAQSKRVARLFKVRNSKISVLFTGFDESSISLPEVDFPEVTNLDTAKPIVAFRGSSNPESGLDIIAEMSNLHGAEAFNLVICTNTGNSNYNFSPSTHLITRRLSTQEITHIYHVSLILIGQISSNKRLNFTIPHKAYEAGYFEKAYISTDRPAIREVYFSAGAVSFNQKFDAKSLLHTILDLINNSEKRFLLERSISRDYRERANQELLGERFIKLILSGQPK